MGILSFTLDNSGQWFLQAVAWLAEPTRLLVSALIFTLVIDGMIRAGLYISRPPSPYG